MLQAPMLSEREPVIDGAGYQMLSEEEKAQFSLDGYLVVPGLVPDELCDAVIEVILEFAGVNMKDESTWYQPGFEGHGIVPLHHHQTLWDLRQYEPIHEAFADLYGTDNLWVSNDRVSYKPPADERSSHWQRSRVHWDCDPWTESQLRIQGLVYLTDTAVDQGAFTCAPGVFRQIDAYLTEHADDENRRFPRLEETDLVPVPGEKGSLVIFNRLVPHTSGINQSPQHRFVQYVTMMVADEALRQRTITEWRDNLLPDWALKQPVSGDKTRDEGPPAELTAHGRKLVGLDPWQESSETM